MAYVEYFKNKYFNDVLKYLLKEGNSYLGIPF